MAAKLFLSADNPHLKSTQSPDIAHKVEKISLAVNNKKKLKWKRRSLITCKFFSLNRWKTCFGYFFCPQQVFSYIEYCDIFLWWEVEDKLVAKSKWMVAKSTFNCSMHLSSVCNVHVAMWMGTQDLNILSRKIFAQIESFPDFGDQLV